MWRLLTFINNREQNVINFTIVVLIKPHSLAVAAKYQVVGRKSESERKREGAETLSVTAQTALAASLRQGHTDWQVAWQGPDTAAVCSCSSWLIWVCPCAA